MPRKPVLKFLVTGDLHVHAFRQFSVTRSDGINSRLWNCLQVFKIIRREAKKRGIDKVILNGDILHESDDIDTDTYGLLFKELQKCRDRKLDLTIVLGNHDISLVSANRLVHSLTALSSVSRVVEHPTRLFSSLFLVPWRSGTKAYKTAIKNLQVDKHPSVLITHVGLAEGRVNSSGFRAPSKVLLEDLSPEKFDLVLLSDYHLRQKVAKNVYYLGSPLQHSFGENHNPCIWCIELFDTSPFYIKTAIPTNLPKFIKLEVQSDNKNTLRSRLQKNRGNYLQISTTNIISEEYIEALAKRYDCQIKIAREKESKTVSVPKMENIEKIIKEYANNIKLARLGLGLFL